MRWKRTVTVVGVHAEGEVGKVVTGGVVDVPGETMFDKMRYLAKHEDGLRKLLLFASGVTNSVVSAVPGRSS